MCVRKHIDSGTFLLEPMRYDVAEKCRGCEEYIKSLLPFSVIRKLLSAVKSLGSAGAASASGEEPVLGTQLVPGIQCLHVQ